MNVFLNRMLRAAKLESQVYEEVESDRTAMGQAMAVVVLSGLAAGIGSVAVLGLAKIFLGTLLALAGWYIWAFLTYFIGTRLLPESRTSATHGELLRTIGFSSSPGILRALGFVPGIGPFLHAAGAIWMLVAMVVAVRQALDYRSTLRAFGVCLIGWLIQLAIIALIFVLFGRPQGG